MPDDMKKIVLYHANCWDGFCAAWLLHKAFPDAEFVPVQYGQDPPDVTGKEVHVVDFSYKRDVLLAMKEKAASIIVLDHHKTAQAELDGLDFCDFDMNKSGGRLTWEFLFSNGFLDRQNMGIVSPTQDYCFTVAPWLVDYTEDRDLWRWKLPQSREITTGLRSMPLEFDLWDKMHKERDWWMDRLAADGVSILRSEALVIKNHVDHPIQIMLGGHKVPAVNATVLFSDIAGKLAETAPFGVAWFMRNDGKIQFSLRSRKGGVDVSKIAKSYGGGGHAAAAGFELPMADAFAFFSMEVA